MAKKLLDDNGLQYVWMRIKALVEANKVKAVSELTNDKGYITASEVPSDSTKQDKLTANQLSAVNSGITSAKVTKYDGYKDTIDGKAGKATTLAGYGITDSMTATQINTAISDAVGGLGAVMTYKGTVSKVSDLPSSGASTGDVYHVTADGNEYAWDGSKWEPLGGSVDLSDYAKKTDLNGYATQTELTNGLATKGDAYEIISNADIDTIVAS